MTNLQNLGLTSVDWSDTGGNQNKCDRKEREDPKNKTA